MIKISTSSSWTPFYRPKAKQARLRLFCFPYAGGGASVFRDWAESLPAIVEICPIQLPGRENQIRERAFDKFHALVTALSFAIQPYLDIPFAFWGHSMGALISFELARQLRRENKPQPHHLFVSAYKAPQLPDSAFQIHKLPDKEFIKELRRLNGTPEEVLQNAELMQLMLPILRADFTLVETYRYTVEEPLDCSISAFGGLQDDVVNNNDLEAWNEQTLQTFNLRMFPGDHFYLRSYRRHLLSVVSQDLIHLFGLPPS